MQLSYKDQSVKPIIRQTRTALGVKGTSYKQFFLLGEHLGGKCSKTGWILQTLSSHHVSSRTDWRSLEAESNQYLVIIRKNQMGLQCLI